MPIQGIRPLTTKKKSKPYRAPMDSKIDPLSPEDVGKKVGPAEASATPPAAAKREPPPDVADTNGGAPAPLLSPGLGAGLPNPMQPGGGVKKWAGRAGIGDRNKIIKERRKKRGLI